MKYALLIYDLPDTYEKMPEDEHGSVMGEYQAINDQSNVVGGARLAPGTTATTVRVQNGDTLTTDGPFAETKEVLGGFFLLEADDIDEALEVAARIPAARLDGAIEVRPIVEH